jgi:DNA-binding NarL/FixJ family response regulator
MIHIAIADDQLLFRKGMIGLLNSIPGFKVIIEAENGEDLLAKIAASEEIADVVLLDINMPILNGLETISKIKHNYPFMKCIMLTVHEEEKYIVKLIDAGANAYLPKNTEPDELERAIQTVVEKDFYFNDKTIEAMRNGFKYDKPKISLDIADTITTREKEILHLICREYTAAEMAAQLFISERTVNGHRNNLLQKTGCKNTAGLVVFAIRHNLYSLDM